MSQPCVLQDHPHAHDLTPPDCFRQSEVELFQSLENQILATVNYYLWRAGARSSFLYALELFFESGETLLLSSGEDSAAIQVINAASLEKTAHNLQSIHSEAVIQRLVANAQPLWRDVAATTLLGIRLARHESGLYRNDALLLDFGEKEILLSLGEKEGLVLGEY